MNKPLSRLVYQVFIFRKREREREGSTSFGESLSEFKPCTTTAGSLGERLGRVRSSSASN